MCRNSRIYSCPIRRSTVRTPFLVSVFMQVDGESPVNMLACDHLLNSTASEQVYAIPTYVGNA